MEEFVKNFANQFDDTDMSVFSPETRFRELEEWSSLIALSVIAMVDEEYDVTLKGDDIKSPEFEKQISINRHFHRPNLNLA